MKLASLFLLCFSFLLLSGSAYRHMPVSLQSSPFLLSKIVEYKQQAQPVFQSKSSFLAPADASGTGYDQLNAIEPEDNDDDDFRFLEWSSYFLQPYHNLLSGSQHCYCREELPPRPHFALTTSDKYIINRAIRI